MQEIESISKQTRSSAERQGQKEDRLRMEIIWAKGSSQFRLLALSSRRLRPRRPLSLINTRLTNLNEDKFARKSFYFVLIFLSQVSLCLPFLFTVLLLYLCTFAMQIYLTVANCVVALQ